MFWFGKDISRDFDLTNDSEWKELLPLRRELAFTKLESIIDLLDRFGQISFEDSLPELIKESGFSEEETRNTLSLLPTLLNRVSLEKRLRAEFIKPEVLDEFHKLPNGQARTKAIPQGVLLHVTAGNVFLSAIDSLIMGFLTKNISLLKVSSQNKFFPLYFAKKLNDFDREKILSNKFAVLHWKGGDQKTESLIKTKVNAILAWGGEEMISSYQKDLPAHVKLLDFGPKISLQVISKKSLEDKSLSLIAEAIVSDIIPWDQSACASPQNLYIEEGIDEQALVALIDKAFLASPKRGPISPDEATEILKEKYRGYYSELMEDGKVSSGSEHLIHLEKKKVLRPSPLHRSLIIKRFGSLDELYNTLEPFSYYLQSCSYLLDDSEKNDYLDTLSLTGIKRFAPLGTVTWGMEGAPHDGRFVLRELVNFIGDEMRARYYGDNISFVNNSQTLKTHFENSPHPAGYIFSSGGTTGEPKYVHFSYEEFDYMSDMLAENLRRQGVRSGMTVANLFVAGNLWSSFLCVEKALEKIGAIQLPIGGMCSNENILLYLRKFKPDAVMGIPSMLVMNAEYMQTHNVELEVPIVIYAGEALSSARQEYLKSVWKTKFFGSAGYASVDAGVIGYQCSHCGPGEHHVFSNLIELSIQDDEAIVTSLARNSMPVKNYRTGDKVEWIEDCKCGSPDRRFKLLGRIDSVIQIWSCRMQITDIEETFSENNIRTFQLHISESREANVVREKMRISYEGSDSSLDQDTFLLNLFQKSRDVKDTIKFMDFKKDIELVCVDEVPRNPRTGKVSILIDQRR